MRSSFPFARARGFSLVEVALSLGIVAFALAGIVALLSATLKTTKSSMDDLVVSEMAASLVNTFRKQDFATINSNPTNIFFDLSGRRINGVDTNTGVINSLSTSAAVAQGAIYECAPTVLADSDTIGNNRTNLWRISFKFQWPAGATGSVNQKTIHADIARY